MSGNGNGKQGGGTGKNGHKSGGGSGLPEKPSKNGKTDGSGKSHTNGGGGKRGK